MHNSQKYDGLFFLSDRVVSGRLQLRNNNAEVSIVGDISSLIGKDVFEIHGKLSDGRQLSLIECINIGTKQFYDDANQAMEMKVYPHFVVVGHEHIFSSDAKITKLTYECEKAHLFCEYTTTFQTLHPNPEALYALIAKHYERLNEAAEKYGQEPILRKENLGEYPVVILFDGNQEIATVDLPSGRLSIWNSPTYGPGTAKGATIKNTVCHTIDFYEPKTLRAAVQNLMHIHQFYELNLGSRQRYNCIKLTFEGMEEKEVLPVTLHWNRCNRRVAKRNRDVHPTDIPVLASTERESFETVLRNWMSSAPSMDASRLRLSNGLLSKTYGYDRLIGAANMFDLLPVGKVPKEEKLPQDLIKAISEAKVTFATLHASSARDSVLSTLGRTGKPSLRSKIIHRAEIVRKAFTGHFRELDKVCHHAVLCRNHYVHGSKAGFDYAENFSCFVFLTDTLEFIFSASDLIECGWNAAEYSSRHGTLSHFVGRYLFNYDLHLKSLEAVLGKAE